jgi:hypothetical protein
VRSPCRKAGRRRVAPLASIVTESSSAPTANVPPPRGTTSSATGPSAQGPSGRATDEARSTGPRHRQRDAVVVEGDATDVPELGDPGDLAVGPHAGDVFVVGDQDTAVGEGLQAVHPPVPGGEHDAGAAPRGQVEPLQRGRADPQGAARDGHGPGLDPGAERQHVHHGAVAVHGDVPPAVRRGQPPPAGGQRPDLPLGPEGAGAARRRGRRPPLRGRPTPRGRRRRARTRGPRGPGPACRRPRSSSRPAPPRRRPPPAPPDRPPPPRSRSSRVHPPPPTARRPPRPPPTPAPAPPSSARPTSCGATRGRRPSPPAARGPPRRATARPLATAAPRRPPPPRRPAAATPRRPPRRARPRRAPRGPPGRRWTATTSAARRSPRSPRPRPRGAAPGRGAAARPRRPHRPGPCRRRSGAR